VDPAPDGYVGDLDAALCEEILDVAIAEVKRRYIQTARWMTSAGKRYPRWEGAVISTCYDGGSRLASPRM
jgi:hypothetical protein